MRNYYWTGRRHPLVSFGFLGARLSLSTALFNRFIQATNACACSVSESSTATFLSLTVRLCYASCLLLSIRSATRVSDFQADQAIDAAVRLGTSVASSENYLQSGNYQTWEVSAWTSNGGGYAGSSNTFPSGGELLKRARRFRLPQHGFQYNVDSIIGN